MSSSPSAIGMTTSTTSPANQAHLAHARPVPAVAVEHDPTNCERTSGGFLNTTLKMTGYRKRRLAKVPAPVVIPPPTPRGVGATAVPPSPASPAAVSDGFLELSSPRMPQSPTRRFVNRLTAVFQRTPLSGLKGRNKSTPSLPKPPRSPKSPKSPSSKSLQQLWAVPKSPRPQRRKTSDAASGLDGVGASASTNDPATPVASTPTTTIAATTTASTTTPTTTTTTTSNVPMAISTVTNATDANNNTGNVSTPTTPTSGSPRTSFFKTPFAPKSPSKLTKFNLRQTKSSQGSTASRNFKAQPLAPDDLIEKLRGYESWSRSNASRTRDAEVTFGDYTINQPTTPRRAQQQRRRWSRSSRPSPWRPLLIDVRNLALYQESHMRDSFNVNLPTLLVKRYRRGNVGNFALDNFITNPDDRERYLDMISADDESGIGHDVIVFDETMDESDKTSPGWTLLSVLERVLANGNGSLAAASSSSGNTPDAAATSTTSSDVVPRGRLYWLCGGFEAFCKRDRPRQYVVTGADMWPPTPPGSEGSADQMDVLETNGPSLARRDSLFSVNTERSSLRRKRSEEQQPAPILSVNMKPPDMSRPRRASNGLGYLFTPGCNTRSDSLPLVPPSTPADPNHLHCQHFHRPSFSGSIVSVPEEREQPSSNMPETPTLQTHPEAAFVVSTILPDFLYLGPEITKPEEVAELEAKGVKRILNMAYECDDTLGLDQRFNKYLKLHVKDTVEEDVEGRLKLAVEYIAQAQRDRMPIYVHCKAGKSRSVTAVLAYLIHTQRWSLEHAYNHVMQQRQGICPNIGFFVELMRLEESVLGSNRPNLRISTDTGPTCQNNTGAAKSAAAATAPMTVEHYKAPASASAIVSTMAASQSAAAMATMTNPGTTGLKMEGIQKTFVVNVGEAPKTAYF